MDEKNPVGVIRDAVAKALVYYYPYAGRLIEGPSDKILVNCTAEGVVFREAIAEVRLDQLRDFMQPPFPYSKEFLVDASDPTEILDSPLMLIQVGKTFVWPSNSGLFIFQPNCIHLFGYLQIAIWPSTLYKWFYVKVENRWKVLPIAVKYIQTYSKSLCEDIIMST